MEVKSRIRSYLTEFIHGHALKDEDDVFALGLVNSLFVMQLVLFVEKEFSVSATGTDLRFDNFKSVNAISDFVQRKAPLHA